MFSELLNHLLHHATSFLDMGHFASAKHYGHLDFIAVFEKSDGLFYFEINVVLPGFGPQSNFFQFRSVLLAAFLGPFALFIFKLPKIHDAANRWFCFRRNLDEIQPKFLGFR